MLITFSNNLKIDTQVFFDISIPIDDKGPRAWFVSPARIEPVISDSFVGKVTEGASVNFNNVCLNPHGNGTHTECVGHITPEFYSIHKALVEFHFHALVVSVFPKRMGNDDVLSIEQLKKALTPFSIKGVKALIIRTLPNSDSKKHKNWSNSNWPYLHEDACAYISSLGIEHLLIDTPSVDKEKDEGKLSAHKAFWNYPDDTRKNATITEMIYVPSEIKDGYYFLNLQIISLENDASPSKPILYPYC